MVDRVAGFDRDVDGWTGRVLVSSTVSVAVVVAVSFAVVAARGLSVVGLLSTNSTVSDVVVAVGFVRSVGSDDDSFNSWKYGLKNVKFQIDVT